MVEGFETRRIQGIYYKGTNPDVLGGWSMVCKRAISLLILGPWWGVWSRFYQACVSVDVVHWSGGQRILAMAYQYIGMVGREEAFSILSSWKILLKIIIVSGQHLRIVLSRGERRETL